MVKKKKKKKKGFLSFQNVPDHNVCLWDFQPVLLFTGQKSVCLPGKIYMYFEDIN